MALGLDDADTRATAVSFGVSLDVALGGGLYDAETVGSSDEHAAASTIAAPATAPTRARLHKTFTRVTPGTIVPSRNELA
jgi:hypothetical protein